MTVRALARDFVVAAALLAWAVVFVVAMFAVLATERIQRALGRCASLAFDRVIAWAGAP